ncbi:MAG: glycosyltransferase family 4 protein [Thermoleophilia bacterium]|nr:glycosyltransferase family 4 protein [Thermoleophilia bacterium]
MNVLYLHQHFATRAGAGGTRSWEFSRRLMDRGHDVTMVAQVRRGGGVSRRGRHEVDGIHLILLGGYYTNHLANWRRAWQFIRVMLRACFLRNLPARPDVVVASSTPLTIGVPGWILARRFGVPFVFEIRDLWPEAPIQLGVLRNRFLQRVAHRLERFLYRRSDAIIPLSPGMEDGVLAAGADPAKVVTIPNASDTDLFDPAVRDRALLDRFDVGDRFVAVHAGMMGPANGLDYVLEAARVLHERGDDSIRILVIGEGGTRQRLIERATELGLTNIDFPGSVVKQELGAIVSSCDAGIVSFADFPVLATNSPNKLFDALAAGLPCVVNSNGWTRPLVVDHDAGAYADVRDPAQLADELQRLQRDPKLRARQGANARRLAEQVFARDRLAARFCDVLEHVAGTPRNANRVLPASLREPLVPAAGVPLVDAEAASSSPASSTGAATP